jgi:uncharacterized membrane protein YhaH (DUF805 family)
LPDRSQLIWLFFRFSGRVSRAAYFLAGLLAQLLPAFFLYRFTLVAEESQAAGTLALLFWIGLIIAVWANVALAVKRLHDFGKPGIIAAVLFVPFISIAAYVVLCLFPGDKGPNQYGAQTDAPA